MSDGIEERALKALYAVRPNCSLGCPVPSEMCTCVIIAEVIVAFARAEIARAMPEAGETDPKDAGARAEISAIAKALDRGLTTYNKPLSVRVRELADIAKSLTDENLRLKDDVSRVTEERDAALSATPAIEAAALIASADKLSEAQFSGDISFWLTSSKKEISTWAFRCAVGFLRARAAEIEKGKEAARS